MDALGFLLGLLVGLVLWFWQRSRANAKMKILLRSIKPDVAETPFSSTSQLSLAIAHQHQVHQQLEEQIETYKQILHAAPIGYLQVDDENRLIWCNPQARKLLNIAPDPHSRPRLLLELVRSYELDQLIEQTRCLDKPCHNDWTFYPSSPDPSSLINQQTYELRGCGFPLLRGDVGIFLEDRQEAVTLMQQRDRWASDVAHELKTPLTSIRLVAETLQVRLNPSLRGWMDRLINETIRLSNLVQDLLDLSQLDRSSSHALALKATDLVELVSTAWLNLEPLARAKHLDLDYLGPEQLIVQVDEPRMYRVLVNLLDNSIKYSPPRQKIQVCISLRDVAQNDTDSADGQDVLLEVIDAGPGFPESALPHVFERFFRADPSRSRNQSASDHPGVSFAQPPLTALGSEQLSSDERSDFQHRSSSGLGLAIVQQIVEAHQGSVFASNHAETGGAWLKVSFPSRGRDLN